LDYALDTLCLECVVADIDPNNLGPIRVATKIGMMDKGVQENENGRRRVFAAYRRTMLPVTA
jgi:RimJ/RimL family protein N-acetyltransferase